MRRGIALLALLVVGCAYYNGMYNAKRLAGRALKAEREGRTFEASNLWGQVAVKAESAVVRHPQKGWTDEARLLHGTALVRMKDCTRALVPLERVMRHAGSRELRDDAAILAGGCRTELGEPAAATAAYALLVDSPDPAKRNLALYHHGRALRLDGRHQEALAELAGTADPRAAAERGATLAALGRVPEAVAVADSLLARGDTTAPWDTLLTWIARADPEAATAVIDRIGESTTMPATIKATLIAQDGTRWHATDPARGEQRFQTADRIARGTPAQSEVRYEAARARVIHARSTDELRAAAERFDDLGEGRWQARGARLKVAADRILELVDSAPAGAPRGDLRAFLAGEQARDSLEASRLAVAEFRRLAEQWPESPFVPKALLALIPLEPGAADSLRAVLAGQYADSPYLAVIMNGDSPRYRVLEDSLRLFALTLRNPTRSPARPAQPRPAQQPPSATPRQPADQ